MTIHLPKKLLVFDKDGTLTTTKSGKEFADQPEDQQPLFDFAKLKKSLSTDTVVAIATNQLGIELGYKTQGFLLDETRYLIDVLNFPAEIVLACPDQGESIWVYGSNLTNSLYASGVLPRFGIDPSLYGRYRKPSGGMLLACEQIYQHLAKQNNRNLQFAEKVFVGNHDSDRLAAEDAKFNYFDINDWLAKNDY